MSEEYIKKRDAINAVVNAERIGLAFGYSRAVDAVREIPPDDVAPVVHAKWIYHPNWELDGECAYQCPKCQMGSDINHNYCMRCGAKMDGWIYEGEE